MARILATTVNTTASLGVTTPAAAYPVLARVKTAQLVSSVRPLALMAAANACQVNTSALKARRDAFIAQLGSIKTPIRFDARIVIRVKATASHLVTPRIASRKIVI